MTWIKVEEPGSDNPAFAAAVSEARAGFPPEYGQPASDAADRLPRAVLDESIVLSHSLIPEAMRHLFVGFAAMLDPKLPLTRRQHEMIATTVSALNRCFY